MKPKISWTPGPQTIEKSNIYRMMQQKGFENYTDLWQWSAGEKEAFWEATVENLGIRFQKKYDRILDISTGIETPKWLSSARINIAESCFRNDPERIAVIYQEENGRIKKVTQKELESLVNRIANGLRAQGLQKGDPIAIDMPMTLEAVAVYLAGVKAGNPVVTVADSFSPPEIAVRLKITQPKLIFTQDVLLRAGKTLPLYQKVLEANAPKAVVIRTGKSDISLRKEDIAFDKFLSENTGFGYVYQDPDKTITVLFSSGTTGEPKAIPWTHVTPIKGASDGYYHHDIHPGDVVCWPTNLGWMMGPWLVFAALINKATVALYYGAPLDAGFGKFVQDAKVNMLGVVPSIVRHWKNTRCMEGLNWSAINCFSSTGEVSNPEEMEYLMQLAGGKPVIEYCGGTEIGGGYVTSTVVQPNIASTFSTQALGGEFVILDEDGKPAKKGEIFLVVPIPGLSNRLLNSDHHEVYFEGTPQFEGKTLRRHGDEIERLDNGYYRMHGRVDDAMNLGGIKVSSVQIEEVINQLGFIKESAAIGVAQKGGGPARLVVYYVENEPEKEGDEREKAVRDAIRNRLNPLFKLSDLVKIAQLPRTASGKVMRRKLRDQYEHTN